MLRSALREDVTLDASSRRPAAAATLEPDQHANSMPRRRSRPSSAGPRMQRVERREDGGHGHPQSAAAKVQPTPERQEYMTRQHQEANKEEPVDFKKVWNSTVPHWSGKIKDQGATHRIHALDSAIASMERSLQLAKRRSAELTKMHTQPITVQSLARTVWA